MVGPTSALFSQTDHVYQHNVHFDDEFMQSRRTPRTQQAVLGLSEISSKRPPKRQSVSVVNQE